LTKEKRVLQFAPDISIEPADFLSYEKSTYGGENSLDIKSTKLDANSYDMVISNHVFEHIDDDAAALRECLRLVGETGLVHICVPAPGINPFTDDWGFADPNIAFHFRNYGADMGMRLCKDVPDVHCIAIIGRDDVTEMNDVLFFFARTQGPLIEVASLLKGLKFVVVSIA